MAMTQQGIELPVSLQLTNLQAIANQIKQFAKDNVLSDSLGGRKIDKELSKVLERLTQIEAKSRTALTSQSDFSSLERDVKQVELGIKRIQSAAGQLTFEDLKIPDDAQARIDGLNARIKELQNNLISFKGTQKEKIISDQGFLSNLNAAAGPKEAAKMLKMGYDELYKTINTEMTKINALLEMKAAAYQDAQKIVTQNSNGKTAMTQWGAVGFLQEAFKSLPKDDSKKNEVQKLMETYMKYTPDQDGVKQFSGFIGGAAGESRFLKEIRTQFELTPQQIQEMIKRMEEQAKTLEGGMRAVWQKLGTDNNFAANMLFGAKRAEIEASKNLYLNDLNKEAIAKQEYQTYETRSNAYNQVQQHFDLPNKEIKEKAEEIAAALQLPQKELDNLKNKLLSAAQGSPAFTQALTQASGEITELGKKIDVGKTKLAQMDQTLNRMQGVQNFINRYIGLYAIVRRVTSFIRNAISNIKELDKNITNIAVVTNMSQQDLWGKIGEYTNMAQQFGVATKDVYTVSQLFYQQGLQTSQVMSLTTETLKMAKISGMEFADAANAMTVAVRAFNIDMQDAQQVTDTYSALAAKFAVSSAEIANAMEKTASSAANVGMSLQSTSAFISVMEQTTREGAQNIGSALKSIISRYGEMKASPSTLIDAEGEETSFNKVDTALKSIGISIKDSSGQFRDFDDVIMELSKKWDTLDNNTQRYIATVMAGNRQQSRFIALVSNYDELNRAMGVASDAENASIVQTAKTMDSLESKTNQLKNAFSQLYLDLHIEDGLKNAYDSLSKIITTIGKMSKGPLGILGGSIPTLLNVVNAGMGMKNIVGLTRDWYQKRRTTVQEKVDADTTKAQEKVDFLIQQVEQERIMRIKAEADMSALNAEEARIKMLQNSAQTMGFVRNLSGATNGKYDQTSVYYSLKDAVAHGQLATSAQRDAFLGSYGILKGDKQYGDLSTQLEALAGKLQNLGTTVDTATQQVQAAGTAAQASSDKSAAGDQQEANSSQTAANSINNLGNAAAAATGKIVSSNTMPTAGETVQGNAASLGNSISASNPLIMAQAANMQAMSKNNKTQEEYAEIIAKRLNNGGFASKNQAKNFVMNETGAGYIKEKTTEVASALQGLVSAIQNATGAMQEDANSTKGHQIAVQEDIVQTKGETEAKVQEIESANEASQADKDKVPPAKMAAQADLGKAAAAPIPPGNTGGTGGGDGGGAGGTPKKKEKLTEDGKFTSKGMTRLTLATSVLRMLAPVITAWGAQIQDSSNGGWEGSKAATAAGNGLSMGATGAQLLGMTGIPGAAIAGGVVGLALGFLPGLFDAIDYTTTEQYNNAKKELEEAEKNSKQKQAKELSLSSAIDEIKALRKSMYDSEEDMAKYREAMSNLGNEYPELIKAYDESGNAVIDLVKAEQALVKVRKESAQSDYLSAQMKTNTARKKESIRSSVAWTAAQTNQSKASRGADIEKILKENKDNSEMFGGITKVGQLIGVNTEAKDLSDEEWKQIKTLLYDQWYSSLSELANAEESEKAAKSRKNLTEAISSTNQLSLDSKTELESNEAFMKLYASYEKELQRATEDNFYLFFGNTTDKYIEFFRALTSAQRDKLGSLDFTKFVHIDQLLDYLDLENLKETNIVLYQALARQLGEANENAISRITHMVYQYDSNGKMTGNFNTDMKGLAKLNFTDSVFGTMPDANVAQNIGYLFLDKLDEFFKENGKNTKIIGEYGDYFADQLVEINKIAENGSISLAQARINLLYRLGLEIEQMDDEAQDSIYSIITQIDFGDANAIAEGREALQSYAKEHNLGNDFDDIVAILNNASANLIFNTHTLAEDVIAEIGKIAEQMQKIASVSKNGIDLSDAIEGLSEIQTVLNDSTLSFDKMYTYDPILKKYIYTADGLQKAIEAQETKLKQKVESAEATDKIWREQILNEEGEARLLSGTHPDTSSINADNTVNLQTINGIKYQLKYGHGATDEKNPLWNDEYMIQDTQTRQELERRLKTEWFIDPSEYGIQETLDQMESRGTLTLAAFRDAYIDKHKNGQYGYTSEIMKDVKFILGKNADETTYKFYEDLADQFLKSTDEKWKDNKDWDHYIQFLEEKAKENTDEGDRAREALKAYQNNIINTMFGAVDWSKIFLGTDLTGTQERNIEAIAQRMELGSFKEDPKTHEMIFQWADSQIRTAEEAANYVIEKYLDRQYGEDDTAKKAARSSIKGQSAAAQAQAVSTAIDGILKGAGNALDETSAILAANAGIEFDENNGLLSASENYVNAALDLYNANIEHLTTIAQRNSEMTKILNEAFKQNQAVLTALNSGAKMDLNTLDTTLTAFGVDYNEIVNQDALRNSDWANLWKGSIFEGILKTDEFGNTQISDWNDFVAGLKEKGVDVASLTGTYEYRNAYSTYVDGMIEADKELQVLAKKIYDNAFSSIADFTHINVSEMRVFDYVGLASNGAATVENGFLVIKNSVQYAKNALDMFANLSLLSPEDLYEQTGWTVADLAKNWKAARTVITQASDTWIGISDALTNITDDTISSLVEKGGLKLTDLSKFTKIGNHYVLALSEYEKYLKENLDKMDPNAARQMKIAIAKAQKTITDLLLDIDWEHLLNRSYTTTSTLLEASEAITNAGASLGIDVNRYIKNGKYDITGSDELLENIKSADYEVGHSLEQKLIETVSSLRDTAMNEINNSIGYFTNGTTSQSDMNTFFNRYNELVEESQRASSVNDLFKYDELTKSFKIRDEVIKNYINGQRNYLKTIGMADNAVNAYIDQQTQEMITADLDIQSFVTGTNISNDTKEAQVLMNSIKQWGILTGRISSQISIQRRQINYHMQRLIHGGEDAVKALIEIKGRNNVTDEEIQAVYRSEIIRLQNIMEELDISSGSILTGTAAEMFRLASQLDPKKYKIKSDENGILVVEAVTDMVTMYRLIYDAMVKSAEATQQELNSQYAKVLTARDQGNIDAIDALNNAMGMDYEAFGALLAKYGKGEYKSLEHAMQHQEDLGIQDLYNGQIRITEFKKLAEQMNWTVGSEAYTEAYKAYNDSIIELDHKTAKAINEELKSVIEGKPGDKINLTWFSSSSILNEDTINELLERYGGEIKDGILTLKKHANIVGITETLGLAAKQELQKIPEEMALLEDALKEYISKIVDAINKGIKGTLTSDEGRSLEDWAKSQNIIKEEESLRFIETTEGLKLSTEYATLLYSEIRKIDGIQGEIIFAELNDSLQKNNDHYKNMASILTRINKLRMLKDSADDTKKRQYEAELEVAERIAAVRATTEDSSFDFMSNKIPGNQNNPLNYFGSWGKAWSTMKEAFKTGGVDKGLVNYEDWYNIVNEMGNLAKLGADIEIDGIKLDGSLTTTSQLIQHGIDALTTSSTGEIKVDLSKLGIDFSAGADGLKAGVNEGIKAIAKSQVDMLDSMIAMLEVVVQMEKLGDLDLDHDMSISVDELLSGIYIDGQEEYEGKLKEGTRFIQEFGKKYKDTVNSIITVFESSNDPKMKAALEECKIGINGRSLTMRQILKATEQDLQEWGIDADTLATLMTGFMQMAYSDEFDPDNVWDSFLHIFSGLNFGDATLSVNAGNHEIILSDAGNYSINFDSAEVQKRIEEAVKTETTPWANTGELQKEAQDAFYALEHGDKITIEQAYSISIATGEIKIETSKEGNTKYKVGQREFDTWKEAAAAAELTRIGIDETTIETITIDDKSGVKGTLKLGKVEFQVQSVGDGKPQYILSNGSTTEDKGYAILDKYRQEKALQETEVISEEDFHKWKLEMGIEVEPAITITGDGDSITTAVQQQVQEKLTKGTEGIQEIISMAPDFGIKVRANIDANNITVDELNQLIAAFGVEARVVSAEVNFSVSGNTKVGEAIETGQATIEVNPTSNSPYIVTTTANVTGFTRGTGPLANPNRLVNSLTARVTELIKKTGLSPEEKLELQTLKAQITSLLLSDGNGNELAAEDLLALNALQAMTTLALIDNKTPEQALQLEHLNGYVTLHLRKSRNEVLSPEEDIEYLTRERITQLILKKINEPDDWNAQDELNLNNLTAFINDVNHDNADEKIEAWRKALESAGITIPIQYGNGNVLPEDTSNSKNESHSSSKENSSEAGSWLGTISAQDYSKLILDYIVSWFKNPDSDETKQLKAEIDAENKRREEAKSSTQSEVRPSRETGEPPTLYGNEPIDWKLYNDEFIQWTEEVTDHIEQLSDGRYKYISKEGYSYSDASVQLPDGWTLDTDGSLYSTKTPNGQAVEVIEYVDLDKEEELEKAAEAAAKQVLTAGAAAETTTQQVATVGDASTSTASAIEGLGGAANTAAQALSNIQVNVDVNVSTAKSPENPLLSSGGKFESSYSNLAKAKGTLMGELGPELVVSNGRYFVVGQNGPEMVNLANDAIVFNHLQTKSLLEKGKSSTRGRAATSETNAVAYAKGNRHGGIALASASSALESLKQLRSLWSKLAEMSVEDLAAKGGGGGGGGGGDAAFIKQLERWYNLLQEIASLEQKITHEEKLRSKIQSDFVRSGKEYVESQKDNLKYLQAEVNRHKQLVDEQQEFFNQRRAELNTQSAFSSLYTFDENGQIKYKNGKFEELSELIGRNATTGEPNHSVKEQYDWLISQGYGYAMQYNDSGEKIEIKDEAAMKTAIEAFWAKIDSDKGEMQELHDSIEEHKNAVLEKQQAQNDILHEIEENQLGLEEKVLTAIEDSVQRQIDELQDQKDAIQESNEALLKGLNDQLNKERQMYQNQESEKELDTKRRRLSILQRSGGSAAEIANLQAEIDTESQDIYFNKQQEQIDAIQEASDNQLEKLQQQIDLMTETLAYQKENGLLWERVYEVMSRSPEEIANFIKENDSSYWGKSPADLAKSMRDDLFEAEKWKAFAAEGVSIDNYLATITEIINRQDEERRKKEEEEQKAAEAKGKSEISSGGGGGNGGSTGSGKKSQKYYEVMDKDFNTEEAAKKYLTDQRDKANNIAQNVQTYKNKIPAHAYEIASQEIRMAQSAWNNADVKTVEESIKKIEYTNITAFYHTPVYIYESGKRITGASENHTFNSSHKCTKCGYNQKPTKYKYSYTDESGRIISGEKNTKTEADNAVRGKKNGKVTPQYVAGGMNYNTGLAMLHGTPSKPEAVLNARQTAILRDDILSSKPNSLMSLLTDFRDAYYGLNETTYTNIHDQGTIVFEHAEVNVNVDKLANGYDAARAGDDIMREMLNIARKTSAQNRIGR